MKLYELGSEKRKILGAKCREYVLSEFNHQEMIDKWHDSLNSTISSWREKQDRIYLETF